MFIWRIPYHKATRHRTHGGTDAGIGLARKALQRQRRCRPHTIEEQACRILLVRT